MDRIMIIPIDQFDEYTKLNENVNIYNIQINLYLIDDVVLC